MNINIKDLRIGNLLRDNGDGSGVHIVEGIRGNSAVVGYTESSDCAGIIESSTYPFVSPFNYQPIKLNKQVRECVNGVILKEDYNSFTLSVKEWSFIFDSKEVTWQDTARDKNLTFYAPNPIQKLMYIHQLQNLYYSLTGEELEIDIDKLNKIIKNELI